MTPCVVGVLYRCLCGGVGLLSLAVRGAHIPGVARALPRDPAVGGGGGGGGADR